MLNQYLTVCKSCGKPILMTRCEETGRWMPCRPSVMRFKPSGGPDTYINMDGKLCRGKRDHDGEEGYRLHRKDCKISV